MDTELTQEAILGPDSEPFETFISDHCSEEKKLEAKSMFTIMKQKDPESLAIKLANFIIGTSHHLYHRRECAQLLCELLITDDDDLCTWHNLSVSTQSTIKCMILDRFDQEESGFIIQEILETVLKLVDSLLKDNNWPELLPLLYQRVTDSSTSYLKSEYFLIFGKLAEHIGETTIPCVKDLHSLFLNALNDDTLHLNVRMAAVRAATRMIGVLTTEKEQLQDLLLGTMRTLNYALAISTEAAKNALECAELLLKLLTDDERTEQLGVEFFTQFQKAHMEAILGPDSVPFENFISDHWSSSEERELKAKSMFNMMKQKDLDSLALKLADYLGPSYRLYFRERCAELLCNLINDGNDLYIWHNLSVSTQSTIKCIITDCISLEQSQYVIQKLLKIVWKLVYLLPSDSTWPELLPSLYQFVTNSSSDQYSKGLAYLTFGKLADHIGATTVPCIRDLHPLFLNALNDDTLYIKTRMYATRAVISFIQCVSSSKEKEQFQDLLPGMLRTLTYALSNSREEGAAHYVLALFLDLAKSEPRFLRMQLTDVVASILEIAEDEKLKEETRGYAVEFLIILVEAKEKAPGMMKRLPLYVSRCFTMLLDLLLDVKDDPRWHSSETLRDVTGATSNFHIGTCLDRFSVALGGKSIAHIAKEQLSAYLAAPEWEKRHAALTALAEIAEGCSKLVMIKSLEQLVNMALNSCQDPHPRVRWAACWAIAQLLRHFSPHLQEQYHNQVIPALAAAMDDFHPRVQACAAAALSYFNVSEKPETLIPYLDGIVNKLLVLLQSGKQMVQLEALLALSHIARFVEEHFQTYYDTVMPHLKGVMRNADLKSNLILCARVIECISSVGFAVGKEKFRKDAEQVMEVLIMSLQGLQAKRDDPPTPYLLQACTRICDCLGQDFLPYMRALMPFIIQCAQFEPATTISVESDKTRACLMLCCCADTLKEDFYPWIPQVVSLFVPLRKFYTQNDVWNHSVKAMPILLCSAKLAVEKGIAQGGPESYFTKLSDDIIMSLVEALHEEPTTDVCAFMLDQLNGCLEICGPLLNERQVRSVVNGIKHAMTESSGRKQELREREKMDDFDAEEAELLREEREQEETVFCNVGVIMSTLIDACKAAFLPFLDELSSYLLPIWAKEKGILERLTSISIFAELLQEFPKEALRYYDACLPLVLDASNDEDPNVRKVALYGLRLWAEYGHSSFKPFVGEALSRINIVITHSNALEPENVDAYDNAVSALSKICQFHGESINSGQVIPAWLNCLPIKTDLDEAKLVHKQLCSLVERSDRELLGPNYEYLPKVVSVFVEVLCIEKDLTTEETANRMINVLRHLQQTLPPATMESALTYLLPRQEMELKSIISPDF